MEAKEKAKELVEKFGGQHAGFEILSIQCALICVEEILSVIDIYPRHQMSQSEIETVEYWKLVKKELK